MAGDYVTRADWGARHEDGSGPRPLPASYAILHHSVTLAPDLVPPFDDDYEAIRNLEAIGEQRFGRGISYTWLFTPAGLTFQGHSIGRVGSHTAGYNYSGIGYCLVGNYSTTHPTREQLLAVARRLQLDKAAGWLDAAVIDLPHSAVKATDCPGSNARASIGLINALAAGPPITSEEIDVATPDENATAVWWRKVPDLATEGAPDLEAFRALASARADSWKAYETALRAEEKVDRVLEILEGGGSGG